MTQFLPQNLLALFAPRDPIPYLPPFDKQPHEKTTCHKYHGVGAFLSEFEDPKDTPPPTRVETRDERKERKRKERAEQVAYKLEQDLALWNPTEDPAIIGDPFKTLFVARVNYDTSESKLRREFEVYGPVKQVSYVYDRGGKPRGYAFIEYEHERDMHSAYKHADGKKIDGRRVLVDVERGRTVKGWRPRRLGGGLGGTRRGGPEMNSKYSGREDNNDRRRSRTPRPDRAERPERPERRRRTRSRSKDGSRPPRRSRRSRSRDRKSRRSRSKDKATRDGTGGDGPPKDDRKRRRSRSKERSSRRSRSRERSDRKRSRRSRSRDRKSRRDRGDREARDESMMNPEEIKQEKISGKTPPHEPSGNGYEMQEGGSGGHEEGMVGGGEYGDVNGDSSMAMDDSNTGGAFDTNEYGSADVSTAE